MKLIPILLATIVFLTACSEQNAEDQIAKNIGAIEEAVERKDFSAFAEYLVDQKSRMAAPGPFNGSSERTESASTLA